MCEHKCLHYFPILYHASFLVHNPSEPHVTEHTTVQSEFTVSEQASRQRIIFCVSAGLISCDT